MSPGRIRHFISTNVHWLGSVYREVRPDARLAVSKPRALLYIALTSYRTQTCLALTLTFVIFLAPPIVDAVTSAIFPPETSKKLLGLVTTQQESRLKGIADIVILTTLWLLTTVSSLLMFWLDIPAGLARANARASRLLAEADDKPDLATSRILYERALAVATNRELTSQLHSRLSSRELPSASGISSATTRFGTYSGDRATSNTIVNPPGVASPHQISQSPAGLDGRYTLDQELGKGAMGVVFSAWDTVLDRQVAVKQLSVVFAGDDEFASRFRREARALARLTHPNVVQVYDLVEDGHRLWMVLEFVDGGDLARLLKREGRLSAGQAVEILLPVAEGLAFAHDKGIVHRDIKPSNILLSSALIPKISDFGIAKLTQAGGLTQIGSVLGSPPYMSPEQCSGGSVDVGTDIYSLGITLYELLCGTVPFKGDTSSVLARQIVEQPQPLSEIRDDIPESLQQLVLRMLTKSPDQRPANMTTVVEKLSSIKAEITSEMQTRSYFPA